MERKQEPPKDRPLTPDEMKEAKYHIERARHYASENTDVHQVYWDGKATNEEPFVFTPLQNGIWKALEGRALKKDQLAEKVCGGEGSRLYKPGGIKELMALGKVRHQNGVGYFRPDAPPVSGQN